MIDLSMLERGMHFDELEDSFVIFLCKFDPFERGMYRYSFQNACEEKPELKLSDGTFKVFINARSAAEDASDEMRALLAYLMDGHVGSDLTRRIEACVEAGRQRETWKMIYFEQNSREATIRREAKVEGERIGFENGEKVGFENGEKVGFENGEKIGFENGEKAGFENGEKVGFENGEKVGFENGEKQNSVDTARKMKTRGFDTETISDLTGLSEEEIEALK
jgi:predicted transposase/invertase (TIGR01784 family)